MNHAGTFARGGDSNFALCAVRAGDVEMREGCLLNSVGGENGLGKILEVIEFGAH